MCKPADAGRFRGMQTSLETSASAIHSVEAVKLASESLDPIPATDESIRLHDAKILRIAALTHQFLLVQALCYVAARGHA